MERGELTDDEWELIGPLLPAERGRSGRPAADNRQVLNGILWIMRTGAPWRDLPERYGRWNSVFRRFSRWSEAGVFDALLEAFAISGVADDRRQMIDSTVIRAHQHAAGAKGGSRARKRSAARVAG